MLIIGKSINACAKSAVEAISKQDTKFIADYAKERMEKLLAAQPADKIEIIGKLLERTLIGVG